jgi:hypothetical protein
MNTTGYIINAILVLLVVRQLRDRRLDAASLLLPVALVAGAAVYYLHSIPTAGNDLTLELALAASGATMGALCGAATFVRRGDDDVALARAGVIAATLWIAGVGGRMGFAYASDHGLRPSIARFSTGHGITSGGAWVAGFVLMALADVLARLVVLHLRGRRATGYGGVSAGAAIPSR